jgi:4-hydroxy-3-methylbut-2-en-1-yl diphosphate reductase
MKTIRADHCGMCFGVLEAIQLALRHARLEPLTVLGELVHNERVLDLLRQQGVRLESCPEAVRTRMVMVTAHGASERTRQRARDQGLHVLEATCPLVRLVHRTVATLVREGFHPVIIGKPTHVEVKGLTEDLAAYDVIDCVEDVGRMTEQARFGVVAQTTQPIDKVRQLVDLIRHRYPRSELRFIDTVCQPTKQRQAAAIELAQHVDVVVVVGGTHSNNTRELVATCQKYCARVHQVSASEDLKPEWFLDAHTVGLTAGTSTPEEAIKEVEAWFQEVPAKRLAPTIFQPATTEPECVRRL